MMIWTAACFASNRKFYASVKTYDIMSQVAGCGAGTGRPTLGECLHRDESREDIMSQVAG